VSVRVWSIDNIKEQRKQRKIEEEIPFTVAGEQRSVTKTMVNGEMQMPEVTKPLGELMTTDSDMVELMEKVVLDVELGRERVPTVYGAIYDRIVDANFPRVLEAKWALEGLVVFLERLEGGDVKMGTVAAEEGPIAKIRNWAAGFEYTEEMLLYDHTFDMEMLNRAFGEAYNALLNHIHLHPIIDVNYTGDNQTSPQGENGEPFSVQLAKTIKQGQKDAANHRRPADTLLLSRKYEVDLEDAMERQWYDGTEYRPLTGLDNIVFYDGWKTTVGRKEYVYEGCPDNTAYLIRSQRGFKELVKHGLMIDGQPGPIRRLVEECVVGRTYRGIFAAVEENVQEVDITEQTG